MSIEILHLANLGGVYGGQSTLLEGDKKPEEAESALELYWRGA